MQEVSWDNLNHWVTCPYFSFWHPFCYRLLMSYFVNFLKILRMLRLCLCNGRNMLQRKSVIFMLFELLVTTTMVWGPKHSFSSLWSVHNKLQAVCPLSESESKCTSGVTMSFTVPRRTADRVCILGFLPYFPKNKPGVKCNPYIKWK